MKHIYKIWAWSLISTLMPVLPVTAQSVTPASVVIHTRDTSFTYLRDFDVLALDFSISTQAGDKLTALTLAKSGTAREVIDYNKVTLWLDQGAEGYQGWGYDKKLADAVFSSGLWVFSGMNESFTQSTQRFFISIETGDLPGDKTLQFSLLAAGDNGDIGYDAGEQGVFLQSQVIATIPEPAYSNTVSIKDSRADRTAPKAFVNGLSVLVGAPTLIAVEGNQVVFTGESRDRNGTNVADVRLMVNGKTIQAQQTDVAFSKWRAVYTPSFAYEALTVQVWATDSQNDFTSESYYAIIDNRTVDPISSTITVDEDRLVVDQTTSVRVIVRDQDGTPLPNRPVTFVPLRIEDDLSIGALLTDVNGSAIVNVTVRSFGVSQVQALVGTIEIGSVSMTVVHADDVPQEPVVIEDEFAYGDLIKGSLAAVYYYARDGKRHVFVNSDVYSSWYGNNFTSVKTISDADLASIPLGTPVSFKPGSLIKVPSVPAVYVVDVGPILRHIETEAVAKELFGETWNKQVRDLSEALLFGYDIGISVGRAEELDATKFFHPTLSIDSELGF